MCVCVCVCVREGEIERVCVWASVWKGERNKGIERNRATVWVCMFVCVLAFSLRTETFFKVVHVFL